jgi:hypothetical protein
MELAQLIKAESAAVCKSASWRLSLRNDSELLVLTASPLLLEESIALGSAKALIGGGDSSAKLMLSALLLSR